MDEVKLYLDEVLIKVEKATEEALKILALRVVERAQMNIRTNNQIDTGFMVNSIYAIWKGGSGYEAARGQAMSQTRGKDGRKVDHSGDMAPGRSLPDDAAAGVVVGANYAIFQELADPFLYPAAQATAEEFKAELEAIFKERMK
jgi:hypothetical protein